MDMKLFLYFLWLPRSANKVERGAQKNLIDGQGIPRKMNHLHKRSRGKWRVMLSKELLNKNERILNALFKKVIIIFLSA